jgi:nicotinate-nucleotide adenylyltransferase
MRRGRPRAPRRPTAGLPAALRTGLPDLRGLNVGLYGGSFDPPHAGHRHVADVARRRVGLDLVIWLVTPGNPLKAKAQTGRVEARASAAKLVARGPRGRVSDIEARIGARYTLDTVRWFKARFPTTHFVWIMGADSLATFHLWKGWADLAEELPIVVVSRPGVALRSRFSPTARRFAHARRPQTEAPLLARRMPPAWIYVPAPFLDLSSTALRERTLKNPA